MSPIQEFVFTHLTPSRWMVPHLLRALNRNRDALAAIPRGSRGDGEIKAQSARLRLLLGQALTRTA